MQSAECQQELFNDVRDFTVCVPSVFDHVILESAESTELEDEILVARTLVDREDSNDLRMVNLLQYLYLALLQSLLSLRALSQFFEAELLDTD